MLVTARLDEETSDEAGAGGTFQVISLEDENGADITDKVDQGVHYTSVKQLQKELTQTLGVPVKIEVEEDED